MTMQEIPLTQGRVALVDDRDYSFVGHCKWYSSNGYALRGVLNPTTGKTIQIFMHRVIIGAPDGVRVDHVNGNKSDNRRANLRLCTASQNAGNSALHTGRRFKGAHWNKKLGKWQSSVTINGVSRYLGLFATEIEAALAYDDAARIEFGEFARLNFPRAGERSALLRSA